MENFYFLLIFFSSLFTSTISLPSQNSLFFGLIFHNLGLLLHCEKPIMHNPAIGDGFSIDDSAISAIFPTTYSTPFAL